MSDHITGQPGDKGSGHITNQPDHSGGKMAIGATDRGPGFNEMTLFWASFLTLIAAGIGFAVRGDILGAWSKQFGFTQSELGAITGGGLTGFGLSIIVLSFFADRIGYGWLMCLAFILHTSSAVVTFGASFAFEKYGKDGAFICLNIGMWFFALGNGACEAVINPLTATLFQKNKTHWLNILHAGWPAGLILGALVGLGFNQFAPTVRWEYKLGVFLVPTLLYGLLMVGRAFPKSEARKSGVSMGTMLLTLVSPVLIFLFLIHAMVGYVELGTDSWIIDITKLVLKDGDKALMAFIWTNLLMFGLRFFAGPIVHKISPLGLLFFSAVLGTCGLLLLGLPATDTIWLWLAAVTVYGIGKTFYWPTMLGVISERFPSAGALALGLSGGIGMISAGLLGGPGIGYSQDHFATKHIQEEKHEATFERYAARGENNKLDEKTFLWFPATPGLDGSKVGVLLGEPEKVDNVELPETRKSLVEEKNILTKAGRKLEDDKNFLKLYTWWQTEGAPHQKEDKAPVVDARLFGGKMALTWTAIVPATMAICYLLLILYFKAIGGYTAKVLTGHAAEDEKFTGGTVGPGEA